MRRLKVFSTTESDCELQARVDRWQDKNPDALILQIAQSTGVTWGYGVNEITVLTVLYEADQPAAEEEEVEDQPVTEEDEEEVGKAWEGPNY